MNISNILTSLIKLFIANDQSLFKDLVPFSTLSNKEIKCNICFDKFNVPQNYNLVCKYWKLIIYSQKNDVFV